jgi:hypothetical protein
MTGLPDKSQALEWLTLDRLRLRRLGEADEAMLERQIGAQCNKP